MNPVPLMELVELIRGIATDDQTFEASKEFVGKLGKQVAVSEDFPAFIVNRILLPMINEAIYTRYCLPKTVIMHPLPRDSRDDANELDNDLNQHPNLAIFRQTDNGVLVRMALFALTLDVWDQIEKTSREVNWYTERRF